MNNCTVSINMGNDVVISVPVKADGPIITKREAYGLALIKMYDANPQLSTLVSKLSPLNDLFHSAMVTIR